MAEVVYSSRALVDFERLVDFVLAHEPKVAPTVVSRIREAVEMLARHPLVGRPVERELRELVISRGRTGYLALYRFFEEEDVVMILAIRHQREAGFEE